MISPKKIQVIRELIRSKFKNKKGEPFTATPSQCWLFASVINPNIKWLWDSAPTRYGKSELLAMALLYLASHEGVRIPIVGGSLDKANKIMEYIIGHVPDHPSLYQGLINVELSKIEKLQTSVSKDVLRWADGGWIFITSIDSRTISKEGEGVVGEGGDVVVLEEAGLIKNKEQFSKIVRMPEENSGWGKLIMSGNCIEGSVFETAYNNPIYYKVRIDLETAIAEGRYTRDRLMNDVKPQTTSKDWKRYFLVEFPEANEFTFFKPTKYEYIPTKGLKYYGALDPALGENKKGSLVGIVVLGVDSMGQAYEAESIGLQLKPEEAIRTVFNLPYEFTRFGVEAVQFQSYFLKTMDEKSKQEKKYIPFLPIQQKLKKEVRIESLEPPINTKQILFKGDNLLWDHMQDYPNLEQMDVLDTLEMSWRLVNAGKLDYEFT